MELVTKAEDKDVVEEEQEGEGTEKEERDPLLESASDVE